MDDEWLRLNRPARYYGRIWSAERRAERARRAVMAKATTVYYPAKPPMPEPLAVRDPQLPTTPTLKARMFLAQGARCYLCGEVMDLNGERSLHGVTVDHVVPVSRGGKNSQNRTLAGTSCNARKADRMPYPCERIYLNTLNLMLSRRGVRAALARQQSRRVQAAAEAGRTSRSLGVHP